MRRTAVVLACCFLIVLCAAAQAVHQPEASDSELAKRVTVLEQQQQQILQQLKLLDAKVTPPAVPPTSFKVQSEPFIGERKAPVAIVEFADFECPYCGQFARDTYPQVLENYVKTGKAVFFYHDFPLAEHPYADQAAEAARCAADQGKYWEMHNDLFAHQAQPPERTIATDAQGLGIDAAKLTACVSSGRYADGIKKSVEDARQMGVRATPSFLIGTLDVDGHELKVMRALRGAYTYEAFKAALDEVLAQAPVDKPDNKQ